MTMVRNGPRARTKKVGGGGRPLERNKNGIPIIDSHDGKRSGVHTAKPVANNACNGDRPHCKRVCDLKGSRFCSICRCIKPGCKNQKGLGMYCTADTKPGVPTAAKPESEVRRPPTDHPTCAEDQY